MPRTLQEETKQQVVNLWLNHNYSQQAISDTLGISYKTVNRIVNEYTKDGSHEPPKDMPLPEPVVQVDEPVAMTEEHTAEIPKAVITAVEDKITELESMIRDNNEQIKSKQEHNAKFRDKITVLRTWLTEVQA